MLVRIENRRALPGLHFDRKNLRGETPLRLRSRGALMAFDRESILCLTADAVFTRYIFRRDAHVTPFKRVTQHRQHSVDRNDKIGRAHVELQSLMRISYAVFC